MKRRFLAKLTGFLLAAAMLFAAVACDQGGEQNGGGSVPLEKTAGYGQEFDLSTLDPSIGDYTAFTVKDPNGETFALSGMTFVPDEIGVWTITFGNTTCNLTVSDVTGPVVHLVGQSTGYTEGDTVPLPQVSVIDDVDGAIAEYTETLTYNGETYEFSETDRTFLAKTPGTYVYTATATDKAGNSDGAAMNITVGRIASREVAVGTEVDITENMFSDLITDDKEYDFNVSIRENGEEISGNSFTVEEYSYYEVYASFTDKADAANVKYGYTVYYAEGTKIFLSDMTSADAFPTSGEMFRIDPYAFVDNRVENVNGNNVLAFTISDDAEWRDLGYGGGAWKNTIIFNFPPVLETVAFGVEYDISFDLCFVGELTQTGSVAKVHKAGFGDVVADITTDKAAGETYSEWTHVTLPGYTISERVGGDITKGVFEFEIEIPNFMNGAVGYIDNITYMLREDPSLAAENNEITYDEGEITELELTAEALGVSGTDGEGKAITSYSLVSATFLAAGSQGAATALDNKYGDKITPQSGIYTITLRGEDDFGNSSDITVTVYYDNYFAPILTSTFDAARLSVAPGTQVTLSPETLGVNITAATDYTVTYEISKNGAAAEAATGSFTVESGAYYEVCVIVTDTENGTNKRYVTYKASDSNAMTFEDGSMPFNIYSPTGVTGEIVEDEYGRKSLKIEGITDATELLLPMQIGPDQGVRFQIKVEGTLGETGLTFSGNAINPTITETGKWIFCDSYFYTGWEDGLTRFTVKGATEGMTVYFDNIVIYMGA